MREIHIIATVNILILTVAVAFEGSTPSGGRLDALLDVLSPAAQRPETDTDAAAGPSKVQSSWVRAKDALAVSLKLRAIMSETREDLLEASAAPQQKGGPPVVAAAAPVVTNGEFNNRCGDEMRTGHSYL